MIWGSIKKIYYKKNDDNDDDDDDDDDDDGIIKINENHIYFYGDVISKNILIINTTINNFNFEKKKYDIIYLHIQSYGGLVYEALSLVDNIINSEIPIHCIIEGIVASAATLISIVCDYRYIQPNSVMMIHQLRGGLYGRKCDVDDEYTNLNKLNEKLIDIFVKYSKISKKKIETIFSKELEYDSKECLKYGFVDEIVINKKRKRN